MRRWVALDDEELLEGQPNAARAAEFIGHAVRTESHVGLTDGDAELALSLLARQPVYYKARSVWRRNVRQVFVSGRWLNYYPLFITPRGT